MKKLFAAVAASALFAAGAYAAGANEKLDVDIEDEDDISAETLEKIVEPPAKDIGVWPAFFAICEIPSAAQSPDIVGFRITIPYSSKHDSVTGFDIGLWGRVRKFEGCMFNLLRNDVKDELSGFQVGLYNTAVQADKIGLQVGLWNEAGIASGFQVGLVNTTLSMNGFQVGLINRSEEMYGVQVGVINVIRASDFRFLPIANIGF
ncbi:MAG: hypothetical protein IKD42_05720 [Kiritimatiellae bacterium]|nr:hypothetical protein [Kiritimatiellia bacterium]